MSHLLSARRRGVAGGRKARPGPYLDDVDPELAEELQRELAAHGRSSFANAILDLTITEPCLCADPSCASFYTFGRFDPGWLWRRRGQTLTLRADPHLSIDFVGGRIVAVEVFKRPALRDVLRSGWGDH